MKIRILGAVILIGAEASALMVPMATTTAVDRADCIVEGRIAALTSRWTDDRATIVTEVMIDASDIILGGTNRVTFLLEGGVVGDVGLRVSDMPDVTTGQRVLVLLREQTPTEALRDLDIRNRPFALLGDAQGLYRIQGDQAMREGFTLLDDATDTDSPVNLNDLKQRIRQRLKVSRPVRNKP